MTTFNSLLKLGLVSKKDKCNFGEETPDASWLLHNTTLADNGNLITVSYESAINDLPKLIVDAFINKYEKIPNEADLTEILSKVHDSMSIAIQFGKVP